MANITVSNDIDTFLQAANNAAAKSALGISELANWEEDGTTLQPTVAGYNLGSSANRIQDIYVSRYITNSTSSTTQGIEMSYGGALNIWQGSNINIGLSSTGIGLRNSSWIAWHTNHVASTNGPTRLYVDQAYAFAMRNGTNPFRLNIYNTYTDASNYERGFLKWDTNQFVIGTEHLGTGTERTLFLKSASPTLRLQSKGGQIYMTNESGAPTFAILTDTHGQITMGINQSIVPEFGGIVAIGHNVTCQNYHTVAIGRYAKATRDGSVALGGYSLASRYTQLGFPRSYDNTFNHGIIPAIVHTGESVSKIFTDTDLSNKSPFTIPNNRLFTFNGIITAQKNDFLKNAAWRVDGIIKNVSNTTTLIASNVVEIGSDNASDWSIVITADDVNDRLQIELIADTYVNGSASLHFVEQSSSNITS